MNMDYKLKTIADNNICSHLTKRNILHVLVKYEDKMENIFEKHLYLLLCVRDAVKKHPDRTHLFPFLKRNVNSEQNCNFV